jgi:chromosome segregation ATPase
MAKGLKVISPSSSDNEIDEENEVATLVKQYGKKGANRIMKLMMKLEELDESLESQEEFLRLEREKSEALEMNLTNESKENKKLRDSLKTKDSILLEVEEALTSERGKMDELTKKLSLVKDTHANLRSDNEKFQENLTSFQAIHTALEIQFNTLVESTSKARESSNSSSPSTSNGCAHCVII